MLVQVERTDKGMLIAIPNELADGFGFADMVEVRRESGHLVVLSPNEPHYNIAELIATITPENRHPEISTGPPRGNEVW